LDARGLSSHSQAEPSQQRVEFAITPEVIERRLSTEDGQTAVSLGARVIQERERLLVLIESTWIRLSAIYG
jgi:hypothetical protein